MKSSYLGKRRTLKHHKISLEAWMLSRTNHRAVDETFQKILCIVWLPEGSPCSPVTRQYYYYYIQSVLIKTHTRDLLFDLFFSLCSNARQTHTRFVLLLLLLFVMPMISQKLPQNKYPASYRKML